LRHRFAVHGVHAHGHIGGEEVAVAVVLVLVAPRVLPVIEDLAAEDMTPDPPGVRPSLLAQHALTHADGVRVDELVSAVAVVRHEALGDRERVVIGRRVAEVEPHERDRR
jgi:hypothetical protein